MLEKTNLKVTFPIRIQIVPVQQPITLRAPVKIQVIPEQTPEQTLEVEYNFLINTVPIEINISEPLITNALGFLETAINTYVDEDRQLKTLLNYGEDKQTVVLNYRYGPVDINGIDTIQLKLLQPVPEEVNPNTSVFLSREVAKSVIDKLRVRFAAPIDSTPYLRPKNLAALDGVELGKSVRNVTLTKLALSSGSVGIEDVYKNKTFEDELFRQWYSYDFNSSELNIDFTDYKNFIFYSSAAMRLAAFREKLRNLEKLESDRIQFLSSSTYTGTTGSAGFIFIQEKTAEYAKQKEDIIRGFDRYEQYLYFTPSGSSSEYTASAYYADEGYEYNPIGYWPKTPSGSVQTILSQEATDWYTTQSLIAQRFDEFNENNLINTIPTHIREDSDNDAYITFVSMIGHFFDIIKPYVDQLPYIWSRNLDPNAELSKDLINNIAESIGFKLPTLDSTYDLTNNILGINNQTPRRELTAEIYKRLLHSIVFFAKSKGTKTSLQTFINSFGITPQIFNIKEVGTPVTSSYYVFDEFTTGLDFDESKESYITLPLNGNVKTLQFNCTVAKNKAMSLLTGDNKWALNVNPHPSNNNLGRFELTSGSSNVIILSSSYHEIFGDELLNVAIRVDGSGSSLHVTQTEGEEVIFSSISSQLTSSFVPLWNSTSIGYLGGAASLVIGRFDGTIDELRLWKDSISDEVITNTAFDPGSNAGDTYDAASDNLVIQLSFNKIDYNLLTASSSILNESPYKDKALPPSVEILYAFNISGSDFSRYNRTVRQQMMDVGSSGYLTSKIKVLPPPVFIETEKGNRLYRTKSIVAPEKKKLQRGRNKIILAASPTDIVNQNIIRNLGLENINAILGSPTTLYKTFEKSLSTLKKHYQQYYYVDVDTNKFIRILSEFGSILNQTIDYFIPSKATVLSGIIIEQNILEQVKIPPIKNLKLYGKNTRRTINAAGSLSSSTPDYGATFNLTKTIEFVPPDLLAKVNSFTSNLTEIEIATFSGNYSNTSGSVNVDTSVDVSYNKIGGGILEPEIPNPSVNYLKADSHINIDGFVSGNFAYHKTNFQLRVEPTASYITKNTTLNPSIKYSGSYQTFIGELLVEHELPAKYDTYNIKHEEWNYKNYWNIEQQGTGSLPKAKPSSIDTDLKQMNKIKYNDVNLGSDGAEPYKRVYSRKLFESEVSKFRNGGNTSLYLPALYDIPPVADFRDFGVYTYFNNNQGIYYFTETFKTPSYQKPLNQTWDTSTQTFTGVATWSYGASYNIYDIVYQDISNTNTEKIDSDVLRAAYAGNKLYYVFKTRPAYKATTDGTAFYTGSVPSYTPPSLDKENWEVLRFIPNTRQVPKRVVFNTFESPNPEDTNFRTTTVALTRRLDIPDRYVDIYPVASMGSGSYTSGEILVQNIATLFAIQANTSNIRVRLYRTAIDRDNDLQRSSETLPVGSHGVLLDTEITTANSITLVNPVVNLIADSNPPAGKLFYTINNLTSNSKIGIVLTMLYFAIEIEPRIPIGYLRKHYRFFRSNSTALKRRNYVGCKNTKDTTIDGQDPVQIFLSEGTELKVSPTIANQEIITGGGGTLNAT